MQERTLDLSGGLRVRLLEEGSGPPLLLLHGNPDNADEWRPLIARLSAEYRCLAPDLPGYGRRGATFALPADYRYTVEEQIRFVDEVLDAAGVSGPLSLVVHDIGGIMGVPWAAARVERVTGVVYTNTVAFPGFQWFDFAYRWGARGFFGRRLAALSMALIGRNEGALFRKVFRKQNPQLSSAELDRFAADFGCNPEAKASTLTQFRELTRAAYFDGYDQHLARINAAVPTVTVWGLGDPYVPDARAADLGAGRMERLEGVGHWVPLLAADPLAAAVRSLRQAPR